MRKNVVGFGLGTVLLSIAASCGTTGTPIYKSMKTITVKVPAGSDAQLLDEVIYPLDKLETGLNHGDLYGVPVMVTGKADTQVVYFDSTVGKFGAFRPTTDFVLTSQTGTVTLTPISVLEDVAE